MAALLYRCPRTGLTTQVWMADDGDSAEASDHYEPVSCPACGITHFINPRNGNVLASDDD
jgi:hypothetical protein